MDTKVSYIGFINSKSILGRRGKNAKETIFDSTSGHNGSIFFNPYFQIIAGTIFPIHGDRRRSAAGKVWEKIGQLYLY